MSICLLLNEGSYEGSSQVFRYFNPTSSSLEQRLFHVWNRWEGLCWSELRSRAFLKRLSVRTEWEWDRIVIFIFYFFSLRKVALTSHPFIVRSYPSGTEVSHYLSQNNFLPSVSFQCRRACQFQITHWDVNELFSCLLFEDHYFRSKTEACTMTVECLTKYSHFVRAERGLFVWTWCFTGMVILPLDSELMELLCGPWIPEQGFSNWRR